MFQLLLLFEFFSMIQRPESISFILGLFIYHNYMGFYNSQQVLSDISVIRELWVCLYVRREYFYQLFFCNYIGFSSQSTVLYSSQLIFDVPIILSINEIVLFFFSTWLHAPLHLWFCLLFICFNKNASSFEGLIFNLVYGWGHGLPMAFPACNAYNRMPIAAPAVS